MTNAQGETLVFIWNEKDRYSRQIYLLDPSQFRPDLGKNRFNCENIPPRLLSIPTDNLELLPPDAKRIRNFDLSDARLQRAFQQIRNGGSSYREEADAAAYLKKNPIAKFDRTLNRMLTELYGVGFVSELYIERLSQIPANKFWMDTINASLNGTSEQIKEKLRGYVFIYVKGLYREVKAARGYDILVNYLRGLGATVIEYPVEPVESIKNAVGVKKLLDDQLKSGKNVFLISLSKGGVDSLLALSMLTSKLEGKERPQGYGKVDAVFSLSGIFEGSFMVDWVQANYPAKLESRHKAIFESEGLVAPPMTGLLALRSPQVREVMNTIQRNGLPQGTTYFNIVGALGGDGLAEKGTLIRKLQDDTYRAYIPEYGANDGYVEYPATEIPANLVKKLYVLPIKGTHTLVDGEYRGMKMADSQQVLVRSFVASMFKILEKK